MLTKMLVAAAEHGHEGEGLWDEVWTLLTDPAHWIHEGIAEITFFTLEIFLIDRFLHWHRRRRHGWED